MARERDLPPALASVSSAHAVPDVAQVAVGVGAVALVLVADVTTAIGFSSFGVLLYYAVTNLAALRQPAAQRRHVRAVPVVGLAGCLLLAATLPLGAVTAGVVVLVVGLAGRWLALCRRARAADG